MEGAGLFLFGGSWLRSFLVPVRYLFSVAIFICLVQSVTSAATSAIVEHPFLFLDASDVPELRTQAQGASLATSERIHAAAMAMLSEPEAFLPPADPSQYGAKWNERFGNNLVPLAMHCLLKPGDKAAFDLFVLYIERMLAAKGWHVNTSPTDEVPPAHSLVGLVTAVDLLYTRLGKRLQNMSIKVITYHGRRYYSQTQWRSNKPPWIRAYVHNHSPTILLGLLMSAMVAERHGVKEARKWRQVAQLAFQRTFDVLRLVVDGSMNEGVGYGTYTTRSLTQYVVLAKRHHLIAEDLTKHPWFKRHLDFLIYTILPGYKETVGISDSSPTWFYGPESQLYFLEHFVLQNGQASWLAKRIRDNRAASGHLAQARSQVWSTLHTELLWHKPEISMVEPLSAKQALLHLYSDWGVATYGGGRPAQQTFVSFKCSFIHGRTVHFLAKRTDIKWIDKWQSFNPGHEQPDQGSFVFFPRGRPFITETLYAPKQTSLNNALMFGPSPTATCGDPLEGQLGECGKWLAFRNKTTQDMSADIITASKEDGMVFMAGEYAKAYRPSLQLRSVFRATLLLSDDILLVLDNILTTKSSKLKYANAFFHNLHAPFVIDGHSSAHLQIDDETTFHVDWITNIGQHTTAHANNVTFMSGAGLKSSNCLNVSVPLRTSATSSRVVWVFSTSRAQVENIHFLDVSAEGVCVSLKLNGEEHKVSIATEHSNTQRRIAWLGSPALAHVETADTLYRFGIGTNKLTRRTLARLRETVDMSEQGLANMLLATTLITLAAVTLLLAGVKGIYRKTVLYKRLQVAVVVWVALLIYVLLLLYPDCIMLPTGARATDKSTKVSEELPEIFVSGLPASGVRLVYNVLSSNDELFTFNLTSVPSTALEPFHLELDAADSVVACPWTGRDAHIERYSLTASWIKTIMKQPAKYVQDLEEKSIHVQFKEESSLLENDWEGRTGCTVITECTGVWNSRTLWLQALLGSSARHVVLVRDPRNWVVHHLLHTPRQGKLSLVQWLTSARQSFASCNHQNSTEARHLQQLLTLSSKDILDKPHKFLAALWAMNTRLAVSLAGSKPNKPTKYKYILRFEDLLQFPEETIRKLFRWLHLPLRPAVIHRLLSLVNTEQHTVFPHGIIRVSNEINLWKKYPLSAIYGIQNICKSLMRELGYPLEDQH